MAAKTDPRAAKARRQKRLAAAGGVAFVILLFIQVPRTLKLMNGDEAASAAATAPAVPAAVAPAESIQLSAEPEVEALASFGRFESKDPFVPQLTVESQPRARSRVTDETEEQAAAAAGAEADGPILEGVEEEAAAPASASISVNGAVETVTVRAEFPADAPMFVLDSIGEGSVRIRVAQGGSFASGDPELTLDVGDSVTLVNTADGTRYVLLLKSVS
ncbi:MAG: hypothetical protein WD689_06235 [Gaiellaceae bacterium]